MRSMNGEFMLSSKMLVMCLWGMMGVKGRKFFLKFYVCVQDVFYLGEGWICENRMVSEGFWIVFGVVFEVCYHMIGGQSLRGSCD